MHIDIYIYFCIYRSCPIQPGNSRLEDFSEGFKYETWWWPFRPYSTVHRGQVRQWLLMNESLAEYLTLSDITSPSLRPGSQSAMM